MMSLMAERDAAFLWETEALRTFPAVTVREPGRHAAPQPAAPINRPGWVTLREASDATGIPVPTLRSWARKKRVPSVVDETPVGTRRMVPLDRVLARADQLGREVDVVDVRRDEITVERAMATSDPERAGPPPGTMIVPIEAWDKMLLQLGNLHEAGQQLAEARERAARAETEARFLRERLAELRANRERMETATETALPSAAADVVPGPTKRPSFTAYLWRSAVSSVRRKS